MSSTGKFGATLLRFAYLLHLVFKPILTAERPKVPASNNHLFSSATAMQSYVKVGKLVRAKKKTEKFDHLLALIKKLSENSQ